MTKTCNVSCRAADKLNVSFKLLSPRRGSLSGPLNRITDAHLRPTVKHPQWICAQVPPCFCRRIPTINWISLSKTAGKRKKKLPSAGQASRTSKWRHCLGGTMVAVTVQEFVCYLHSQNPPLTAKSLDYQASRCKLQRTISSVNLGGGNPPRPVCRGGGGGIDKESQVWKLMSASIPLFLSFSQSQSLIKKND